jgi:hypothetical protein
MLAWVKEADRWRGSEGPFVVHVAPKGDGRWSWAVHADATPNPTATGTAASLGAAKTACEQFVRRSGRV